MLSKRTTPVIGKLTNSFVSGNRAGGIMDVATSPRGPLEFKIQSPRGLKNYDIGGVGLGIVAALEKSAHHDHRIGNDIHTAKVAFGGRNSSRSNPIPVTSARIITNPSRRRGGYEEVGMDSLEDYTFVTCHGPGNQSFTRVYYDGGCQEHGRIAYRRSEFDTKRSVNKRPSMFTLSSPARIADFPAVPDSDFLRTCHLCQKKLQGKDIYMYRGEKAFCSSECRDIQILVDEQKEMRRSEALKSLDVSSSPYKNDNGQILSPGIFVI